MSLGRLRMTASSHRWMRQIPGLLWAVVVAVVLLGAAEVRAQAVEDTSRTAPSAVEPAALDSLPVGQADPQLGPSAPPADTGETARAFVNADSLSTRQRNGERVQELFGNVFVQQDTTRLRSAYALRFLTRSELLFVDDVVVYERGDTLRADTVRYDRATEVGRARGNVQLTNGDVTVRADSAIYYAAEKRSVFPDSVVLIDSNRVLRAQRGTYWSDDARAEFGGRVRLTEPGTTLLADSLTYYRDRDRSVAYGNVFIDRRGDENAGADTTARTYLFGDRADNREARRYSRVDGKALMLRVRKDSTGTPTDTLVVRARRLEAFRTDTHRRLVAVDSVRIWQPDLSAVADSAVYDRVVAATPNREAGAPVPIDTTRPASDSIMARARGPTPSSDRVDPALRDTVREQSAPPPRRDQRRPRTPRDTTRRQNAATGAPTDSLASRPSRRPAESSRSWVTPTAQSDSVLPIEETRLFGAPVTWFQNSQVWGDSIRVRARNRSPDTVFVRGAGFAAQRDSVLDRIQQLKAENIVAFFSGDTLRRIRARPNARAIRFLAAEDQSLNGAAQTSGDRIELRFRGGSVRRVSVIGGTQTTYYRTPENIPDPFELEGFQWTPNRRPTRRGLLRDERARRQLDLDTLRRSRPVAGPVPRPDSVRYRSLSPDSMEQRARNRRPSGAGSVLQRNRSTVRPGPDSTSRRAPLPDSARGTPRRVPVDTTETQ